MRNYLSSSLHKESKPTFPLRKYSNSSLNKESKCQQVILTIPHFLVLVSSQLHKGNSKVALILLNKYFKHETTFTKTAAPSSLNQLED